MNDVSAEIEIVDFSAKEWGGDGALKELMSRFMALYAGCKTFWVSLGVVELDRDSVSLFRSNANFDKIIII